ncbi:MAG: hypothetical protein Q8Q39_05805 [bacterium]|nr:hypothetical protein [bacterium]
MQADLPQYSRKAMRRLNDYMDERYTADDAVHSIRLIPGAWAVTKSR